jgi:hypothetical protein
LATNPRFLQQNPCTSDNDFAVREDLLERGLGSIPFQ